MQRASALCASIVCERGTGLALGMCMGPRAAQAQRTKMHTTEENPEKSNEGYGKHVNQSYKALKQRIQKRTMKSMESCQALNY